MQQREGPTVHCQVSHLFVAEQIAEIAFFRFHHGCSRFNGNRFGQFAYFQLDVDRQAGSDAQRNTRAADFLESRRSHFDLIVAHRERAGYVLPQRICSERSLFARPCVSNDDGGT